MKIFLTASHTCLLYQGNDIKQKNFYPTFINEFHFLPHDQVFSHKLLLYFSEEALQKGFSIIIDNRSQFWKDTTPLFSALKVFFLLFGLVVYLGLFCFSF